VDAENRNRNRTTAVFVCLVLAVVVSAGGFSLGAWVGGDAIARAQSVQSDVGNNTTLQHENPASVDERGNLSVVETWLSDHLTQSLINCTQGLKVGQYAACNRSRGNYPQWLAKYVEVTRKTDAENNSTESFKRAAESQETYASNVSRFRRTLSAYRAARENGTTTRARTLARRLQRIAARVNGSGTNLTRAYRRIGTATAQNMSNAIRTTNTITRNVTETADAIEVQQFINTTLVANISSQQFSFRRPLRVSGQLEAANGTPLANRRIRLVARNQTRVTTTTNATGGFTLAYRPTVLPVNTTQMAVRYAPSVLSPYRDNETTVPVRVEQVEPRLTLTQRPTSVAFAEAVVVSGRVSAAGRGAGAVPVAVSIAGQPLTATGSTTIPTTAEGRFRFIARLPADVPAGEHPMRVSVPLQDRALNRTVVTKPVTVERTPTRLSVDGSQISVNGSDIGGPELRVSGRLATANGTPVAAESVAVRLNGTTVGTVRTNQNGTYRTNVTVPQQVFAGRAGDTTVSLVASYDGSGSNLASARATRRLTLILPSEPSAGLIERLLTALRSIPIVIWLVAGGLVLAGVVGAYRYRDRSSDGQPRSSDGESPVTGEVGKSAADDRPALLDVAREQLFAGNMEHAIATAYAAVRTRVENELDHTSPQTHWEFFEMCRRRDLGNERLDALQRLTEVYERAAYAPSPPSEEATATAIEAAQTINGADQQLTAHDTTDD
jgi:hypothetical protein